MALKAPTVWVVRHADTEWSRSGQHTSRTDLPLLPEGETAASALHQVLARERFSLVLSSPLQRASRTAQLCGFTDRLELCSELREWDYGEYEGRTSAQIQTERPGWDLWNDGCPGGESLEQLASRCQTIISRVRRAEGNSLIFAHGHVLRAFAALWLQLPAARGRSFGLRPASIGILGVEHANPVIWQWDRVE
ncbi:MAG: histidine phosphatase family protein [Phycisphaerales bacterium]|nr:histidine phosphatase family protein [Phycisphaerales bacterium]